MNFQTLSKQRKMILIAAAVGVIAMFLPWWSISLGVFGGGSINGMHNEGLLIFLCFVAAGVLSIMGDQTKNLSPANWMSVLLAGGLATLITLITFLNALEIGNRGVGLYLALLAAIGIIALAYLHRSAGDTLQSGFEALKNKFSGQPAKTDAASHTTTTTTTKVINPVANDSTNPTV